jgi:50S ribosomal protein L16 3-hydroxylase
VDEDDWGRPGAQRYRDPTQTATPNPGALPGELLAFAREAVQRALAEPGRLETVLGEWLTEPKPRVWFEPGPALQGGDGVRLDVRTRMMYDPQHVFINGESFRAGGRDARLMRQLADARELDARLVGQLSPEARDLLDDWVCAGWLQSLQRSGLSVA